MDQSFFNRLCYEAAALSREEGGPINTYHEKRLHAVLKRYYAPDEACHEQKVGRYIADILRDGEIIEIQTGSLAPLKAKLAYYLSETDCRVTVVHPLAAVKWVSWLEPESGALSKRRRSPKKESLTTALHELVYLLPYLKEPRLRFVFPLLELEDYRLLNGWSHDRKRGSNRYERIPLGLLGEESLSTPDDYIALLPPNLSERFGASEVAKAAHITSRQAYASLKVWLETGAILPDGKERRRQMYVRGEQNAGMGEERGMHTPLAI